MGELEVAPPRGGIRYFKLAKKAAEGSTLRYRVGACLVDSRKKIILGCNQKKTHPKFANPNVHIKLSIHAELACLRNIKNFEDFRGKKLYVYRETIEGSPAMARPCEHCMEFIRKSGIKEIYYTTSVFPYWAKEEL